MNKTANADAYIVYRTVRGSSAVLKIGTTTTGTIIDKNPVSGKTASYYAVATSDNPEYGMSKNGTSKNITLASATKKVSVKKDRKAVKVSWKKVKKAKTYYVYRSRKKASGYARIAKVSAKRNYYVDRKVKVGKKYYYRVVTKGKTAFSNLSKPSKAVKAAK